MSSAVPPEIAGLGSSAMKLRVSPGFDPLKAQVGPDEYFVLSRIDGAMTLRDVLLSTGLPVERGIAIVMKLRSIGALLLPGETSAPVPAAAPTKPSQPRIATQTPSAPVTPARGVAVVTDLGRAPTVNVLPENIPAISRTATPATPMPASKMPARPLPPPAKAIDLDPPTARGNDAGTVRGMPNVGRTPASTSKAPPSPEGLDAPTVTRAPRADINLVLPQPTDVERAALAEPGDLGPDDRLKILAMARLLDAKDPWALLGVPRGADAKMLKRAYFKLSKDIHPDRYYGRSLGSFAERLTVVFEAVSRAYARLTSPEKSKGSGAHVAVNAEQPQSPQEYASELFERACGLEVQGDALGAMKLFAAVVRIDGQTRYLRRAASCALAAGQPKTALEYAKKAQTQAPQDPSSARLLAQAFRAAGKLGDAEEVLVMAMALKSENDVLTAELRSDLAEVRRQIAAENR
ncbi:MAG TPA: DnaJ domain-containing protein [Kofleriaceae bacterium]|nr:DnaJ domain-containing protein [Kofleriaceae bacterium]